MPYSPQIQYVGDRYISQGLTNAGNSISDGIQKALQRYQEGKQQSAFNDTVIDQLKDYVPTDALARYHGMSGAQQNGIVNGAMRNATLDIAQRQAARQDDEAAARSNLIWAQGSNAWSGGGGGDGSSAFTPSVTTLTPPGQKPIQVWSRGPNQWELTPESQPGNPMAGQKIYNNDDGSEVGVYDQNGKAVLYHSVDPQKKAQADQIQQLIDKANSQGANKAGPGFSILHPSTWGLSGGGAAQTPSLPANSGAAPAGAPTLMPQNSPTTPAPQANMPQAAAMQQAAAIKAQVTAGQLTREQGVAQLQALGFQ